MADHNSQSALRRAVVLSAVLLLVVGHVCGVDPSYTDCRPHIDATIRDLASQAISAGKEPTQPPSHDTDDAASVAESSPPTKVADPSPDTPSPDTKTSAVSRHQADKKNTNNNQKVSRHQADKKNTNNNQKVAVSDPVVNIASQVDSEDVTPPVTLDKSADQEADNEPEPITKQNPEQIVETKPSAAVNPKTEPVVKLEPVLLEPEVYPISKSKGDVTPQSESKTASLPKTIPEPETVPQSESSQLEEKPKSEGVINRFVATVFGQQTDNERDPKWAMPWQRHSENIKTTSSKKVTSVNNKPGIFGMAINKFVAVVFGSGENTERDPKWAKPWQTHPDRHMRIVNDVTSKKVEIVTGGILHNIVSFLFGNPKGPRDEKFSQPWQKHEEHTRKFQSSETKKQDKVVIGASGGIFDRIIKLLFPTPQVERDPKFAKPWQTHDKTVKVSENGQSSVEKNISSGIIGKFVNKFVAVIFGNTNTSVERDEKWSKPWQTHEDHVRKHHVPQSIKTVQPDGRPGFGFMDKFITIIFGSSATERDEKWSKPWQSHVSKTEKEASKPEVQKTVGAYGGIIDKLIKYLFDVKSDGERDSKWAQPWQTHKENKKRKTSTPPEVKPVIGASGGIIDTIVKTLFVVTEDVPRDIKWSRSWQTHDEPASSPPNPVTTPDTEPSAPSEPDSSTPKSQPPSPTVSQQKSTTKVEEKALPDRVSETTVKSAHKFPSDKNSGVSVDVPSPTTGPPPTVAHLSPSTTQEAEDEVEKEDLNEDLLEDPEMEEQINLVPSSPRSRDHIDAILGLDESSQDLSKKIDPISVTTLKELKNLYGTNIKPLENTYKYQDISNRHMSDAEIFNAPMVLMLGPYSTGKSSFLNYLMGIEYTRRALRTGANPSLGVFRVIQYGSDDQELDGTALSADRTFQSLQKFGQNFVDQLRGNALNVPLLKKVTFVEAPGILEMRRAGERLYPFNDVLQWFIDRADLVLVMFDYTKLDAGYEMEAMLDQLKGREAQVRILLNKADQIPPEELIKVQGSLFWNLSPLLGVSAPPTVYAGSFSSRPYRPTSPGKLFQAQEEALLHDIAKAINSRVDNRVAIARRHAVRVRNHAQMVDTYLTTYNKNKGFLTSKHKLSEDIVENPHSYNIYEGMSLLTNISRYDLPDPEIYRDFFRVHNLYDFSTLKATCSYVHGCPLDHIDRAISNGLPELLARYRKLLSKAGVSSHLPETADGIEHTRSAMPTAEQSSKIL